LFAPLVTMITFHHELGIGNLYICAQCGMHLSRTILLESRQFQGNSGQAILVTKIWNYRSGPKEDKQLRTGPHTIQDTFCIGCGSKVGWRYVHAYQQSQKYKENKFILELAYIKEITTSGKLRTKSPTGRLVKDARTRARQKKRSKKTSQPRSNRVSQTNSSSSSSSSAADDTAENQEQATTTETLELPESIAQTTPQSSE